MTVEVYCDECGELVRKDLVCWSCYQKIVDSVSKLEEIIRVLEAKL